MAKLKDEYSSKDYFPLHPKYVNPKNVEQVNKCAKDMIEYEKRIENSPIPAILYRTYKEPYRKV